MKKVSGMLRSQGSDLEDAASIRKKNLSINQNIYAKNRGTSYFVSPLNVSTNPKMIKNSQKEYENLANINKRYINANTKVSKRGGGSVT